MLYRISDALIKGTAFNNKIHADVGKLVRVVVVANGAEQTCINAGANTTSENPA